jgi:hypothetical protein
LFDLVFRSKDQDFGVLGAMAHSLTSRWARQNCIQQGQILPKAAFHEMFMKSERMLLRNLKNREYPFWVRITNFWFFP